MTRKSSCHGLDMLAEVPDPRNNKGKRLGLFSFRLFAHFSQKVAIRRSLLQRRALSKSSKLLEN